MIAAVLYIKTEINKMGLLVGHSKNQQQMIGGESGKWKILWNAFLNAYKNVLFKKTAYASSSN